MALTLKSSFLTLSLFFFLLTTSEPRPVQTPFKPDALFLSLRKDPATGLHVANLRKRTPPVTVPLIVDLNGRFLWVTCDQNYSSLTYHSPFCHSAPCARAGAHYCRKCISNTTTPGCHNNSCAVLATNPINRKNSIAELAEDAVSIQSVGRGFRWATVRQFLFACAPSSLLQEPRPQGVRGIAGLSHTQVSLPVQLASHFGFRPQFALCLASNNGGIFFGDLPPKIQPRTMAYTPLSIGAQGEYFILIKSIKINNITVPFNTSLLSTTRGFGGTMISTISPYTVLQHSVFETFTQFFAKQLSGVPRVAAVPPFGLCFDSRILPPTRVGTPNIEFVFQNRNVRWTVLGVDALVRVGGNVSCLAFVDGGSKAKAAITIGAYQLENNLVQFDLLRSRLGFIPSRLSQPSFSCSDFNFSGTELPVELDAVRD